MARRIVSITGSRADYGLMEPVHRAIAADDAFDLELIVTGMHLSPGIRVEPRAGSRRQVRKNSMKSHALAEDTAAAMACSVAHALLGIAGLLGEIRPDILLLQGDRGEMLAGAIVAAHMNVPIVHMSGGDFSGLIDDSVRNAISKFAHFHLTTCKASTQRLIAMREARERSSKWASRGWNLCSQ